MFLQRNDVTDWISGCFAPSASCRTVLMPFAARTMIRVFAFPHQKKIGDNWNALRDYCLFLWKVKKPKSVYRLNHCVNNSFDWWQLWVLDCRLNRRRKRKMGSWFTWNTFHSDVDISTTAAAHHTACGVAARTPRGSGSPLSLGLPEFLRAKQPVHSKSQGRQLYCCLLSTVKSITCLLLIKPQGLADY